MKKSPIWLLLPAILMGLSPIAGAFGKRAEGPAQGSFHLARENAIPSSWSLFSFSDGRPEVIAVGDTLQFLESSTEITARVEKPKQARLFFSQNEKYVGIQEISPGEKPETEKTISLTLYDHQGVRQWSWHGSLGDDQMVPSFYISNRGQVIMVSPLEAVLSFLGTDGAVEKSIPLFEDAPLEMERPMACAFSSDGERLVVNALYRHARVGDEMTPREKGQSFVLMFDHRGQELWRQQLKEEISHQVAISPNGKVIAAGAHSVRGLNVVVNNTSLYDADGELLCQVDVPLRLAAFSSEGDYLLLGQKRDLCLMQTENGKIFWQNSLDSEAGQIRALDLSPDGSLALVQAAPSTFQDGQFIFTPVQASLYDRRGRQIWMESFSQDTFTRPLARFIQDGAGFLLAFQERYLIYEQDR